MKIFPYRGSSNAFLSIACALLMFAVALPSHAASEEVYVVNIQEVIAKSNAGNAIRQQVEKEAVKRRAKVEQMTEDVKSFEADIQKQASLLSKAALVKKKDALFQKRKDLARVVQDEKEFLQRESGKAVTKLVEQIQRLLPELVEDTGAVMIIEKDPKLVVYVSEKYDVTDSVIELLNKRSVSF